MQASEGPAGVSGDGDLDTRSGPSGRSRTTASRGRVVLRSAGPHAIAVHALLRYLEVKGYPASPRVVGSGIDEDGREVLSFTEGEMLDPRVPSEAEAASIGARLRELHRLTADYSLDESDPWQPWFGRSIGRASIIGHCDVAPWNVIVRQGGECAFVDWEFAGPVDPLVDLAQAGWLNARLFSDDVSVLEGLPPAADRALVLRAIVDGYELATNRRRMLLELMLEFAAHSIAAEADEHRVQRHTRSSDALWGMAWRSRSLTWMLRHRRLLEGALKA